jgi:hypothetical protein
LRDWHFEHVAGEFAECVSVVDAVGAFENLDDGFLAVDFEDLAFAFAAVA